MSDNLSSGKSPISPDPSLRHPLRVVFEHTNGPRAGLLQIMGLTSDLGASAITPPPSSAEKFQAGGRQIDFASLVKVTRTYALYRELPRDTQGELYPPRVR